MFEQQTEEGREQSVAPEGADEGRIAAAPRPAGGFRCYSLEVLLRLED